MQLGITLSSPIPFNMMSTLNTVATQRRPANAHNFCLQMIHPSRTGFLVQLNK